ncbi:DNA helicase RecQ [Alteribacter natronophilus]|uniref:DNA helicase RecQ n=1 Tax=Alteribacter natronophilus TaxID=2583810 RepID=UPI00110EFA48|nr:DNA helicase RecQ [Alteribacter natronophilus]TMW70717.1 DNA helicase RecQ [Alteribacter natronophilus]
MIAQAEQLLHQHFGYEKFRPGQEQIISRVFEGRPVMGIMPTGGGKSICYQIPSLLFPGLTLVISPLISLMKDQVDELKEAQVGAAFINSSLSYEETDAVIASVREGEVKVLYVAPERFEMPGFIQLLRTLDVALIAVDEAHCVSQWGHDFRPSYMRIPEVIGNLGQTPSLLALTATATPEVRDDICRAFGINADNVVQTGFARDNLSFHVLKGQARDRYITEYVGKNAGEPGIIYTSTRKEAERIHGMLENKGLAAGKYHGGMSGAARQSSQEDFVYDRIDVMVATNAFGMGINKSNVRYVIHFQIPGNIESYYQEAGRAGRDGEPSECVLLYSAQDVRVQQFLIDQGDGSDARKQNEMQKLRQMVNYCHTEGCLQSYILEYFGDSGAEPCGRCSSCTDTRETEDVTRDAQMVFSCIKRMNERFGKTMVAQVLTGSSNQKVREMGFEQLSTYGLMKSRTAKDVGQFIDYLVAEEYLRMTGSAYPVLALGEKAVPVLKGHEKVVKKAEQKVERVAETDPLFAELRELRRELAREHSIAPYMVFSDRTLKELCRVMPRDEQAMLTVKGVGEQKIEKYGTAFLERIAAYAEKNGDSDSTGSVDAAGSEAAGTAGYPAETVDDAPGGSKQADKVPSHFITFRMYEDGASLEVIAEERGIKRSTAGEHLLRCADEGEKVDFSRLVGVEVQDQVRNVVKEVDPSEGLKPVKEALPDGVEYFQIKAVLQGFV